MTKSRKDRSKRLDRIVSLANSEERRWGEQAGKQRQQLEEQRSRLGELNAYRHNYATQTADDSGISSVHLKDYQHFLQRLDKAVSAQKEIIQDSERNYETLRQRWMVKRQRRESLERMLEKHQRAESAHVDRLEQKSLDDLPQQKRPYAEED